MVYVLWRLKYNTQMHKNMCIVKYHVSIQNPLGKVAPQSCPKMSETKKRKNVTCEIVYLRHRHHLFHDLDGIFVASLWPW
jgi:hypothetical protein